VQIPFFPLVKKDLTFIHFGNDSRVDGLVNFEKLRMIAKEIHQVTAMSRSDAAARSSTTVSSVSEFGKTPINNNNINSRDKVYAIVIARVERIYP